MEIQANKEWYIVLEALAVEKGVAILLGGTDSGKSTFAKFLITHLCERGLRTALVDADIGQSFLGPPTTIGLSVFQSSPNWEGNLPSQIFFVGSTTPEGHFSIHLKGVKRMMDKAVSNGVEVILVDTTGFVFGETAKELKKRKIDLLSPRLIIALQRSDELEGILELYKKKPPHKIYRLPISELVRSRSREERRYYRTKKFSEYFETAEIKELAMDGILLEGEVLDSNGFSIPLEWATQIKGLLLGLKDMDENTLALGVINDFVEKERTLKVSTPLYDLKKVKSIQLGSLRLTPSFEEERF